MTTDKPEGARLTRDITKPNKSLVMSGIIKLLEQQKSVPEEWRQTWLERSIEENIFFALNAAEKYGEQECLRILDPIIRWAERNPEAVTALLEGRAGVYEVAEEYNAYLPDTFSYEGCDGWDYVSGRIDKPIEESK